MHYNIFWNILNASIKYKWFLLINEWGKILIKIMEKNNLSLYLLNFMTNVMINFDHGIIPACTNDMKLDLGIDDVEVLILIITNFS